MTANNVISFAVFTEARALSLGMTQAQATNAALIADAAESKLSEMHNTEQTAQAVAESNEQQRDERQAKQKEEETRLVENNPHLVPTEKDCLTDGAKNLRKELKDAFKGVKFSVRTERFSMGDAIRVSWTDGPKQEAVDGIVSRYQ